MSKRVHMSFGKALDALIQGDAGGISRECWQGRQVIFSEHLASPWQLIDGQEPDRFPCLVAIFTEPFQHHPGWVPTQHDMHAADWFVASKSKFPRLNRATEAAVH